MTDRSGLCWLLVLIPGALWYAQMSKKWFWLSKPVIGLFIERIQFLFQFAAGQFHLLS